MSRIPHQLYDLRPLKTVDLLPPDFRVNSHLLIESFIEKEVKFAGVIHDIPVGLDPTNRTEVLRIIDQGKRNKTLPRSTTLEQDVIFYVNAHNIKLSTRDKNEEVLIRLPIHQIAAMSYVCEDDCHILAIKYGDFDLKLQQKHLTVTDDTPGCHLVVLSCDCQRTAEEICSILDQCFQAVYTEATMHYFDRSLMEGMQVAVAGGAGTVDYSITDKSGSSTLGHRVDHAEPATLGFLSHSSVNLGTLSTTTSRSLSRTTGRGSDGELSAAANELILDYMKKLYTKLNADELHRFALLVKAWHTDLSFSDFCKGVLDLYGPDRKYLFAGMQPFIPAKDLPYFSHFLEHLGISSLPTESSQSSRGYRAPVSSLAWYQQTSSVDESIDGDDLLSELSVSNDRFRTTNSKP